MLVRGGRIATVGPAARVQVPAGARRIDGRGRFVVTQALAAATIIPARWLGAEREFGSIAPGRRADLIVLDADPLRDIRNTTRISTVLVGGRVLERPTLDESIEKARRLLNP